MRRPLRIDFAGALYHVMSRGNRREDIFRDETDRVRFLDTLDAACLKGVCFRGSEGLAPGFDLNGNLTTVNYPSGTTDPAPRGVMFPSPQDINSETAGI